MNSINMPDGAACGLDLFAAAWLEQWVDAGGSVQLGSEGNALLGFPTYRYSPDYVEPATNLPDSVRARQREFNSAFFLGKMRGMLDLIESTPGGHDALKSHLRAHGMTCYFGKVGEAS